MDLEIRTMTAGDLGTAAQILDAAYGPSAPRAARVRRYVETEPTGWVIALSGGEPAGMAGALDFGSHAYVGLVGVLPAMQRRGIALAMMEELLARLDRCGTILLDASAAGLPLYRKMGFVADDEVDVWSTAAPSHGSGLAPALEPRDVDGVLALDRVASGGDRERLIRGYFEDCPSRTVVTADARGRVTGYAIAQTHSIGPWIALDPASASALLTAASGLVLAERPTLAVPRANRAAAPLLRAAGFEVVRALTHMRLGEPAPRRRELVYGQASLAAG